MSMGDNLHREATVEMHTMIEHEVSTNGSSKQKIKHIFCNDIRWNLRMLRYLIILQHHQLHHYR